MKSEEFQEYAVSTSPEVHAAKEELERVEQAVRETAADFLEKRAARGETRPPTRAMVHEIRRVRTGSTKSQNVLFVRGPSATAAGDAMLAALRPWAEQVRKEIVEAAGGRVSLPFTSVDDAARWIEKEGAPRKATINEARFQRLEGEVQERLKKMRDLVGADAWNYNLPMRTVAYGKPGSDWTHRVPAWRDSPLAPLARAAEQMSKATGFQEAQMTLFILTDKRPLLTPASITARPSWHSLPTGGGIRRQEVTLTLRTPEISFDQLRRLFRRIRHEWQAEKGKSMTARDLAVLKAAEEEGGVPSTWGKGAPFFRRVQKRLARRGISYKTYRSVEAAYDEAVKKRERVARVEQG